MRLSTHFTLSELTRSEAADRGGLDNRPPSDVVNNLKLLCDRVLEPIRAQFGEVRVNSGYRSTEVNAAVGGSKSSQHVLGMAADIECPAVDNFTLCEWVRDNLEFDQCLAEFIRPDVAGSGWCHVSFRAVGNRKQCLTINRHGTQQGLVK